MEPCQRLHDIITSKLLWTINAARGCHIGGNLKARNIGRYVRDGHSRLVKLVWDLHISGGLTSFKIIIESPVIRCRVCV
jgi:hypothetical protein